MGATPYKAFVSSTYEDLKTHRAYVIEALRKAGLFVDPMEDWTAESDEPKKFSADRVEGCDLCVLLVALRRGFVPPGETMSITQVEYQTAIDHGMDVLAFLLDEEAPWPRRFDQLDDALRQWRRDLETRHGRSLFGLEPSTIQIAPALTRWVTKQSGKVTSVGSDWVQLVSNVLGLPKNEPETWTVAARLLPYALAAVEREYYQKPTEVRGAADGTTVQDMAKSKPIRTLIANTKDFFDESRSKFERTCFVIMPFGKKRVGDREVDFDAVYHDIFVPAIGQVRSPDGESLLVERADQNSFGTESESLFRYLEYSRLVLCDITSLNPSVFYELGVRYRARSSGTVIFRQVDTPVPFDINQVKAFSYDPQDPDQSCTLISRVLTESLLQTKADSPVHRGPSLAAES
jgi:hypothetical protein